jgi:hypothetical protein
MVFRDDIRFRVLGFVLSLVGAKETTCMQGDQFEFEKSRLAR